MNYLRRVARWSFFGRRVNLVVIRYKSGRKVRFRCEEFSVNRPRGGGPITGIEWKRAQPEPFYAGVDNIESIYLP